MDKQAMMERLREFDVTVEIWSVEGDNTKSVSLHTGRLSYGSVSSIYDRIVREFPEEAVRKHLGQFMASSTEYQFSNLLADLKRLWEGQEKGGCPKCEGTGKVPIPRKSMEQENKYWETCLDCDGTGERRKEKRREIAQRMYDATQTNEKYGRDYGRRHDEERRKAHNAK